MREAASIVIRNLEDELKVLLRIRAARRGRSMEEEVRIIPRSALGGATGPELLEKAQALFGVDHGFELDLPSRHADR